VLAERSSRDEGLAGLAMSFFPKAAKVVTNPWLLAGNTDLAFAKTQGERQPDFEQRMAYMAALDA
jgi:hypothetical protein